MHLLNHEMFPNLKHLKIEDTMDRINQETLKHTTNMYKKKKENIISNISSFIENGLQSLHIKLDNCSYKFWLQNTCRRYLSGRMTLQQMSHQVEIDQMLDFILHIFQTGNNNNNNNNKKNHNNSNNSGILISKYINVMLGFKLCLNIKVNNDDIDAYDIDAYSDRYQQQQTHPEMLNIFESEVKKYLFQQIIFQSDETRKVDKITITDDNNNKMLVAAVIKNWNTSEESSSCQSCHMEPKYQFECNSC